MGLQGDAREVRSHEPLKALIQTGADSLGVLPWRLHEKEDKGVVVEKGDDVRIPQGILDDPRHLQRHLFPTLTKPGDEFTEVEKLKVDDHRGTFVAKGTLVLVVSDGLEGRIVDDLQVALEEVSQSEVKAVESEVEAGRGERVTLQVPVEESLRRGVVSTVAAEPPDFRVLRGCLAHPAGVNDRGLVVVHPDVSENLLTFGTDQLVVNLVLRLRVDISAGKVVNQIAHFEVRGVAPGTELPEVDEARLTPVAQVYTVDEVLL